MAELFVDSAAPAKRPPVIKVDLHRPPHGDPSGDGKAFPRNDGPSAALVPQQSLAEYEAYGKEYQPDEQAAPALIQQSLELQIVDLGTVRNAQLTMNSSASASRSFSIKGEGSIELKQLGQVVEL